MNCYAEHKGNNRIALFNSFALWDIVVVALVVGQIILPLLAVKHSCKWNQMESTSPVPDRRELFEERIAAYVVVSADSIQGGNNRIASRVCHRPADQRDTIYSRMRRQGKLEGTCMLQNNVRILLSYGSGHEAAQAKACGTAADVERWVAF